jgi:hypothetical protein
MYGNYDGHWASWHARGILEWGRLLDFSPFSPFIGTGSLFPPNLPWLNPGALALAIPAPLPVRHFASMLVYLTELSVTLYLLYRHLDFAGTLVPRNNVVSLLIVYSPQRIRSVSALVRARARKCSLDRRDECSNYRIDPGGIRSTRPQVAFWRRLFRGAVCRLRLGPCRNHDLCSRSTGFCGSPSCCRFAQIRTASSGDGALSHSLG